MPELFLVPTSHPKSVETWGVVHSLQSRGREEERKRERKIEGERGREERGREGEEREQKR